MAPAGLLEMVRTLAVPLALVALGLAVVFGVIRPVLRDMRRPRNSARKNRLDAVVDDVEELPALTDAGTGGAAGIDAGPGRTGGTHARRIVASTRCAT